MINEKKDKKTNFMLSKKKFPLLLIIATLFIGIGYASVNSIIFDIGGTAMAKLQSGVFLTDVNVDSNNTVDGTSEVNTFFGTMLDTSVTLNSLSSELTLLVTVYNDSDVDYIFSGIRYLDLTSTDISEYPQLSSLYSNSDIIIDGEYKSLVGTKLAPYEYIDIPITFKYDSNVEIVTDPLLNVTINFMFDDYEKMISNIKTEINPLVGVFSNYDSVVDSVVSVTNNNSYSVVCDVVGNSNTDILLSGTANDIIILPGETKMTTLTLKPAKNIYLTKTSSITVSVQIKSPLESIEPISSSIQITTYGSSMLTIINNNYTVNSDVPDFNQNITDSNGSGLYSITDPSGTGSAKYFRGVVENNYVELCNMKFRILRINKDGTLRLILDNSIGTSAYGSSVTFSSSAALTKLNSWYESNINSSCSNYINTSSKFINDTGTYSYSYYTMYNGWKRIYNREPSIIVGSLNTYIGKVGLITGDELMLAGATTASDRTLSTPGSGGFGNSTFFVSSGVPDVYGMWTMTPFNTAPSMVVFKSAHGIYREGSISSATSARGLKPVIDVVPEALFKGNGTASDPYVLFEL